MSSSQLEKYYSPKNLIFFRKGDGNGLKEISRLIKKAEEAKKRNSISSFCCALSFALLLIEETGFYDFIVSGISIESFYNLKGEEAIEKVIFITEGETKIGLKDPVLVE